MLKFILFLCVVSAADASWDEFNEKLFAVQGDAKDLAPCQAVSRVMFYLDNDSHVLDLGSETGKNAIHLLKGGHRVTLLDISQNAIEYSLKNIEDLGLSRGVVNSVVCGVEEFDTTSSYDAVVGTFVFSFIHPDNFEDVMDKILGLVKEGGYFAGHFFGPNHSWAIHPALAILSKDEVETFFKERHFEVVELDERDGQPETVNNGLQRFHQTMVVAKKSLNHD